MNTLPEIGDEVNGRRFAYTYTSGIITEVKPPHWAVVRWYDKWPWLDRATVWHIEWLDHNEDEFTRWVRRIRHDPGQSHVDTSNT